MKHPLRTSDVDNTDGYVAVVATLGFGFSLPASRSLEQLNDAGMFTELNTFGSVLDMSMNMDFETPNLVHFSLLNRPSGNLADNDEEEEDDTDPDPDPSSPSPPFLQHVGDFDCPNLSTPRASQGEVKIDSRHAAKTPNPSSPSSAMDEEEVVPGNDRWSRRRAFHAGSEITHSRTSFPSSSMGSDREDAGESLSSSQIARNRQEALNKLSSDLSPGPKLEEGSNESTWEHQTAAVIARIREEDRLKGGTRTSRPLSGESSTHVNVSGVSSLTEENLNVHNQSGDTAVDNVNEHNDEARVNQVAHIVSPSEKSALLRTPSEVTSSPFSERKEEDFQRLIEDMTPGKFVLYFPFVWPIELAN